MQLKVIMIEPRGFEDRTPLGSRSNPEGSKIEPLSVRDRTQRVRRSNPSGFDLEPRRVRRSNPSGFVSSNLEGFMSSNPSGFDLEPRRVRRSNPEGSIFEPSGFHEPRGFVLRTLWVPRTQKGSYLRTLLGSRSNPEGSIFEPSGFHEPRRVRNPGGFDLRTLLGSWNPEGSRSNPEGFDLEPSGFEERTLWVRGTQRVRRSNPLGSRWNPEGFEDMNPSGFEDTNPEGFDLRTLLGSRSNPEGFDLRTLWVRSRTQRVRRSSNPEGFEDMNPSGFEDTNPEGFDLRTRLGSRSNPEGFDLRTLWVRSRTQRVRRSSKMNFEDEVHLRRTKMKFIFELQKTFFFFFFLVEIQSGSPPLIL
ncbi:hypothetical protein ACOSP7_012116 [Xanthoceras sorbifolium]